VTFLELAASDWKTLTTAAILVAMYLTPDWVAEILHMTWLNETHGLELKIQKLKISFCKILPNLGFTYKFPPLFMQKTNVYISSYVFNSKPTFSFITSAIMVHLI
jgi:hypothetical protein